MHYVPPEARPGGSGRGRAGGRGGAGWVRAGPGRWSRRGRVGQGGADPVGPAGEHGGVLDEVVPYLTCAHCGAGLARAGGSLRCRAGHVFDIARQGYVSLIPARARVPGGDTAAMVAARVDFLATGHFAGLAAELGRAAAEAAELAGRRGPPGAGCVVDVGAGTGYYLAAVLDRLPDRVGLALDASRF